MGDLAVLVMSCFVLAANLVVLWYARRNYRDALRRRDDARVRQVGVSGEIVGFPNPPMTDEQVEDFARRWRSAMDSAPNHRV